MKNKDLKAVAFASIAIVALSGCTSQATESSEAKSNTSSVSSASTIVEKDTEEQWSLLDNLPEWSEGTVTPSVTEDPNSGVPFGENPLNNTNWTNELALWKDGNNNEVSVSPDELKSLPINGYIALNREDEGYSIKEVHDEYDSEKEPDRNIQDYCVAGENGVYYQIGSYATDGSYTMMLDEDAAKEENMTFDEAFNKGLY